MNIDRANAIQARSRSAATTRKGRVERMIVPLRCPFCGAKPYDDKDPIARRIMCETDRCAMNSIMVPPEQWNKRHNEKGQP